MSVRAHVAAALIAAACHALGPEFHYWQDRGRCVRFLP